MATHTIRKSSQAGIGYSVVDLNDVRHVFAAAVPRRGLTLRQQADDALRTVEAVIQEEGTRGSIVHQAVFVPNVNLIDECRQIIRDFYGKEMLATSYIPPPPCEGNCWRSRPWASAVAWAKSRSSGSASNWSSPGTTTSLVPLCGGRSQYCNGSIYAPPGRLPTNSHALASVNIRLDQVIRTWLYLGGIVADEDPAALQGTQPRTDRLLRGHPLSGRPLAIRPPGTVYPWSAGLSNADSLLLAGGRNRVDVSRPQLPHGACFKQCAVCAGTQRFAAHACRLVATFAFEMRSGSSASAFATNGADARYRISPAKTPQSGAPQPAASAPFNCARAHIGQPAVVASASLAGGALD